MSFKKIIAKAEPEHGKNGTAKQGLITGSDVIRSSRELVEGGEFGGSDDRASADSYATVQHRVGEVGGVRGRVGLSKTLTRHRVRDTVGGWKERGD